jgi:alkylation response protein AidB-like acyl-CoA dehydrogenase
MHLSWSDADRQFRDEVRAFLDAELTPELRHVGKTLTSVYAERDVSLAWQKILYDKGWLVPAWPVEHGGCGWSLSQRCPRCAPAASRSSPD